MRMGCSDFSDEPTDPSPGEGWHVTRVFVRLWEDPERTEDRQTGFLHRSSRKHTTELPSFSY